MNYSPGQVVLLFTGAAFVSVVLICLLNAEANNRKMNREPEIVNGNLFSALGHQVKRLARRWALDDMTNQSYARNELQLQDDVLFNQSQAREEQQAHLQDSYSGMDRMSGIRRRLSSLDDGSAQPQHSIRHARHKNKTIPTTTSTTTTSTTTVTSTSRRKEEDIFSFDSKSSQSEAKNDTTGVKRRLGDHEQCFTTQEVLWIITITCGVNFTFVFLVLTCVRILGAPRKVADTDEFTGMESAYDTEVDHHKSTTRLCPSRSYNSVQEYVDSLPDTSVRRSSQLTTAFSMEDLLFV